MIRTVMAKKQDSGSVETDVTGSVTSYHKSSEKKTNSRANHISLLKTVESHYIRKTQNGSAFLSI